MKRLSVLEFEDITRDQIPARSLAALQRFDEQRAKETGSTVFDWSRIKVIRSRSWVGVIQVPGLQIEVLPKTEVKERTSDPDSAIENQSRRNLLYMLSFTRDVLASERGFAHQELERMPLMEAFIAVFSRALLREIRKGYICRYEYREENASCYRGKLLLTQQLRFNLVHRERCYVGYDLFTNDTLINQVLKATCRTLLKLSRWAATQQSLMEILVAYSDVEDIHLCAHHFDAIQLDRNSERMRPLLTFARSIFSGHTPALSTGERSSFSLLFPMEQVFEEFVARFIARNSTELGFQRERIKAQSFGCSQHLLESKEGKGFYRLKPDLLFEGDVAPELIVDTKWKRLDLSFGIERGVAQSDIYQLYAYANRYDCADNVLLFPWIPNAEARSLWMPGDTKKRRIRIAFLRLEGDLKKARNSLIEELRTILKPA